MGENTLSGFGPTTLMKRSVRIRMRDVVGAEVEKTGYPIAAIHKFYLVETF